MYIVLAYKVGICVALVPSLIAYTVCLRHTPRLFSVCCSVEFVAVCRLLRNSNVPQQQTQSRRRGQQAKVVSKKKKTEGDKKVDAEEEEEDEISKRDKGKAEKFGKLLKTGRVPEHVCHMWYHESKKAPSQRAFPTEIINRLMVKGSDGQYRLNTDQQFFEQYRHVYTQHKAEDKSKSLPKTVMLASHFHGNEALLTESIANGEISSHFDKETNVEFLSFRELSISDTKVNEQGENVRGSKKVSQQESHALQGILASLKWKWHCKKAFSLTKQLLQKILNQRQGSGHRTPDGESKVKKN